MGAGSDQDFEECVGYCMSHCIPISLGSVKLTQNDNITVSQLNNKA